MKKLILFPLWASIAREDSLSYLKEMEHSQWLTSEELKDRQWVRLKALLNHAYKNTEHYRSVFDSLQMKPDDINSASDFARLPFLTKVDIQEQGSEMIAVNYDKDKLYKNNTGGSTGHPLTFYLDERRKIFRDTDAIMFRRWCGWNIGDRMAQLWGAPQDLKANDNFRTKVKNILYSKMVTLNTFDLTEKKMHDFAKLLTKFKPKVITGYANSLYLFAEYLIEQKIENIAPQGVISTAEVLLDSQKELIKQAFHCKVYNRYGCREMGMIAQECSKGSGLHINTENIFLEIIKDNKLGPNGEIVVTDLWNYGMPFIRYKIGDLGAKIEKRCNCGRGFPLLDLIAGRTTDFIRSVDGKLISGSALTLIIKDIAGFQQIQFIQNEVKSILVKIVKSKYFQENDIELLNSRLKTYLGHDMKMEHVFVDSIPKEKSGKYRFTISTLPF